jgi:aryl-alcohol dehydrogenase-like predicted oxidoreductase
LTGVHWKNLSTLIHQNSIGILARGTVAGGLLTGKPVTSYLGYSPQEVSKAAECIRLLSSEMRTPAQTAIRFALQQPGISSAVVGIRTKEQLKEAISVFDSPPLSGEDFQKLIDCIPANRYTDHR